ncbi:HD domain-containing protein [Pelagibius litoralis]|uniref:HD domain-containing protein n=1 Tax=Pelagibius litoralis TaxID=374515 RepID=A0A967C501_9PROT|nr:phosphonate degradation HD-domain oxygenase [Pelagibius litoralis]NIA67466.1 HD domain-containing protein [Pelagibius litoralis]
MSEPLERDVQPVQKLLTLLENLGGERYGGEDVSQLEHALQCAMLAQENAAPESLVVAALLHDIGHLVNPNDEGAAAAGIDAAHERTGAAYLARWFGPAVTAPIAQHVAAKRYLCQAEDGYFQRLSDESVRSLAVQGGPFSETEAEAFLSRPYAEAAIALRRWDEAAKDPEKVTPSLGDFRPLIERALATRQ